MATSPFDLPELTAEHEERLLKAITALMTLYPLQKLGKDHIQGYKALLARFPIEAVEAAVMSWMHDPEGDFFPTGPKLIERIGRLSVGEVPAARGAAAFPTGEDAWREVMQVRKAHGSYRDTPIWRNGVPMPRWEGWSHPVIEEGVQFVGGWAAVCACSYEDEPSLRARFIARINALRDRERKAIQYSPLRSDAALGPGDDHAGDEGDYMLAERVR